MMTTGPPLALIKVWVILILIWKKAYPADCSAKYTVIWFPGPLTVPMKVRQCSSPFCYVFPNEDISYTDL